MKNRLQKGDALLIIDVQTDFFPGGALPVPDGDKIIPIVNEWIAAADAVDIPIFASRDWHPKNHCSFKEHGGLWPEHCVQNSPGAEFHPAIHLPDHTIIINKADTPDFETHSAFEGKTVDGRLPKMVMQQREIKRLWVLGLTLDYCVSASIMHGCQNGYEVHLILAGTRAITVDTGQEALKKIRKKGAIIETNPHVG
jgi:nicotinamidase/pyrazinamidase